MTRSRRISRRTAVLLLIAALAPAAALAGSAAETPILPPLVPWDGASRALAAAADDPWITPAEKSGLTRTPSYDETMAWLRRLAAAAPEVEMISAGKSGEGRDLWLVVACAERTFSPAALRRSGKPIVLVQAGIHSGEIDGKDAGMMLLRDLTVGGSKRALLDRVHLLFVPIFNPDGHERSSPFSRFNQRGPAEMGWRTNSLNLNLNRDYTKADTPEMQAMLAILTTWEPDLYVDVHVTDGIDYQYDVTWGFNRAYSPAIARWLETVAQPVINRDLERMGHIPGPLIFPVRWGDPSQGLVRWTGSPRFSNAYGDVRHLPTILIENHSLKPFEQRVLGTYVFLESLLGVVGREGDGLRRAIGEDRARRPEAVALSWERSTEKPEMIDYLGIERRTEPSTITGREKVIWTGRPVTVKLPMIPFSQPAVTVRPPAAYWIPPAWSDVIARLELHGIAMERLPARREVEVEMYRLEEVALDEEPYEGRARVAARPVVERRRESFPAGSVRVPTDQPLGELAVLLLEPAAPDSFFQWGFFLAVLQRTEYFEGYIMEPMAERMLAEDESLRAEFEQRLAEDPDFAADPRARLGWFYQRTPFFDARWRLYPVAREVAR